MDLEPDSAWPLGWLALVSIVVLVLAAEGARSYFVKIKKRIFRCCRSPQAQPRRGKESKCVQSQCTYRRDWKQPRFQVLGELDKISTD